MNITQLHTTCKEATKSAFEDFKIHISNPIFPLDDDIIAIEIQDMKQTIGQKVLGKLMDANLSKPQMKVLEGVMESYIKIAVRVGNNYARKLQTKP